MPVSFDLSRHGFTIRAAEESDAAVRMLLPQLTGKALRLVAIDGEHGLVIGAAAASLVFRPKAPQGPGIAIHVIPSCRRHGVGRKLLEELAGFSQQRGAEALFAMQRVEEESDSARAWRWLKFQPCDKVKEHELPLDQFEPILAPLHQRMIDRGKIPGNAQIIPLFKADKEAVVDLHLSCMGGDRHSLTEKIEGKAAGAFHPRYSRVLMLDDQVVGCILAHRQSREVAVVDANIVSPDLRGRWANIWLKLEATRGALSLGIQRFHFTSFDHYSDTRSFTKRLGGVTTKTMVLMCHRFKFDKP